MKTCIGCDTQTDDFYERYESKKKVDIPQSKQDEIEPIPPEVKVEVWETKLECDSESSAGYPKRERRIPHYSTD